MPLRINHPAENFSTLDGLGRNVFHNDSLNGRSFAQSLINAFHGLSGPDIHRGFISPVDVSRRPESQNPGAAFDISSQVPAVLPGFCIRLVQVIPASLGKFPGIFCSLPEENHFAARDRLPGRLLLLDMRGKLVGLMFVSGGLYLTNK